MKADVFFLLIETKKLKIGYYLVTWKLKSYRSVFSGTPCIYTYIYKPKRIPTVERQSVSIYENYLPDNMTNVLYMGSKI